MAKNRSLLVQSVDQQGNKYQKTITHVNTETTNAQLDSFSRAYVGLSTNTYKDTIKVETESINEALAEEDENNG